ncbi:MerR family transcriptional regulator [Rouxiella badensis]|uniref:MerR family transcriptional regulator n=1 Tax=Rouxiella badensis TaxID=1646377 RepID=UPI001D14721D|nr:MerR family transcriptional regulator [Rouxiella badensis]MCC3734019.1 MerR family transcriptional regulator [Rouxiella badensis]MCC3759369.1 MerR family transcriptional regulator [Rouxiella badensis]
MEMHSSHPNTPRPLARHYSIETTAQLCGVLPITLRTWQRYGLIHPQRDAKGSRWYSESDLTQLHTILRKVTDGTPIAQIRPHLSASEPKRIAENIGPAPHSSWHALQAEILNALGEGELLKLRRLIWQFGREYPLDCLVNRVLRPIRAFLSTSRQRLPIQQKGLLDSIIIEYATYLMRTLRHRARPQVLLMPMQIDDPLELWLESLRLCGEGLNVEIVHCEVEEPDLAASPMEHYLIWSDTPLDSRQQAVFDSWLTQGLPVMLLGKATLLKAACKYQNGGS